MTKAPSLVLRGALQLGAAHEALLASGRNPELADLMGISLKTLADIQERVGSDEEKVNFTFVSPKGMGKSALTDVVESLSELGADPTQPADLIVAADELRTTLTAK